ncbi:MAG TPA: NAD(P)-dependent oxidoreductase [Acidimicrobiales bacterium]|nr:NAD(P)-dependent oxidoreductase [Acidimicrobiales bacterium]
MRSRAASRVVVNMGSRFADGLLAALEASAPHERFVGCKPGEPVPTDADALVTLTDDPAGVVQLMAPHIRWVHMLSTGVDGFPLAAAGDRLVTCSRGASGIAIAEWVLAVMLAFEKRLPDSWITAPPPQWNVSSLGTLAGRTVGIVGLGAIGSEVARRALAFDMTVVALRRTQQPSPLAGVALAGSLRELLADADHVVVAAPATSATSHLLDAEAFAACKPGVHLVNVARGALVDQDALLDALDRGIVARASLDVVDPEPLPSGHPLYGHPGVRLSPHVSWSAPSSMKRTFELFVDNLRRYRAGEPLHGVVDLLAGY